MTPRTKHTCFLRKYEALQRILGDVEFLAERRSFMTAAKRFGEFRTQLEQHLKDEEEVLLPRFAQSWHDAKVTLDAIDANRLRLLNSVESVATSITNAEHPAFCVAMNMLDEALEAHRANEEQVVHPALEDVIKNDEDWEALCAQTRSENARALTRGKPS